MSDYPMHWVILSSAWLSDISNCSSTTRCFQLLFITPLYLHCLTPVVGGATNMLLFTLQEWRSLIKRLH